MNVLLTLLRRVEHANHQTGQAYTEYGLILVLVGITVIGALTIMGQQFHAMWHTITAAMPR